MIYPEPITRLIKELSRLPGIGEKTASRLAFYIINSSKEDAMNLANSIIKVKDEIAYCSTCFNLSNIDPCAICDNGGRDANYLCVVEKVTDLIALEKTGGFKGRYHVLHGALSPIHGIGPEKLRIKELLNRIEREDVREIVIATNPNVEGEATALYLSKLIKPLGAMVTRIAFGVPMGGEIEYIDGGTLSRSLDGRREFC
ncbi:MAG: recombination mediator RecR [Thermodesulfobacteriota bacterium]